MYMKDRITSEERLKFKKPYYLRLLGVVKWR